MTGIDAMSEIEYEPDHTKHSVGGSYGHWFRRVIHLAIALIAWIYYEHGQQVADILNLDNATQFAALVGLIYAAVEAFRLKYGITVVGQREYEAHQVSALFWGVISVVITMIVLEPHHPQGVAHGWLGYPLIASLAFGDPALGEMRRAGMQAKHVALGGTAVVFAVWICCWYLVGTPLWLCFIMPPLTVAAEWPKLKWIDDNGTMLLIPLVATILLLPFL